LILLIESGPAQSIHPAVQGCRPHLPRSSQAGAAPAYFTCFMICSFYAPSALLLLLQSRWHAALTR
jgi:hypothetical protein